MIRSLSRLGLTNATTQPFCLYGSISKSGNDDVTPFQFPKRPPNSYAIFVKENWDKFPKAPVTETMKKIASQYRAASPGELLKYTNQAALLREEYEQKMKSLTPEQLERLNEEKAEYLDSKRAKNLAIKAKTLGRPSKPMTAYMEFIKKTVSDRVSIFDAAKMYKDLPREELDTLQSSSQKRFLKYHKELAKWEFDMFLSGNESLVRKTTLPLYKKKIAENSQKVLSNLLAVASAKKSIKTPPPPEKKK